MSDAAAAFWCVAPGALLGRLIATVFPKPVELAWEALLPSVLDGRMLSTTVGPVMAHTPHGEAVETTLTGLSVPRGQVASLLVTLSPEHAISPAGSLWSVAQQEQVGSAVHDLNNLLQVIGATVHLLHDDPPGTVSVFEQHELLAELDSATQRGKDIVHALRVATPRANGEPAEAPPGGTHLTTALRLLTRGAMAVLGPTRPLTCFLDPTISGVPLAAADLEQVVQDLMTNARDAMPDGGPVHLATTRRPCVDGPGDVVDLVVRDAGVGMSPEVQAHALDAFYSTKPRGVGTGLGLSAVARRVRAVGGEIRLMSQLGHGTTVILTLPHIADSALRLSPLPCAGGALLLVASDTSMRRVLQGRLEQAGCDVLVAASGADGVALARTTPTRLTRIVADLALSDLADGSLLAAIQHARPECELFVLATSPSVPERTILPPGTTILPPPVDIGALIVRLGATPSGSIPLVNAAPAS